MENENIITLQLQLSRRKALFLLAAFFLCWHPRFLGSETLTLTTYYPAPYGGYASLLTTSQTLLARDNGNVGVGTPSPAQKFQVNVTGGNAFAVTTGGNVGIGTVNPAARLDVVGGGISIDGGQTIYSRGRLHVFGEELLYLLNRSGVIIGREWGGNGNLTVQGDLAVNGTITGLCRLVYYGVNAAANCSGSERVFGWYGDGNARVAGMLTYNSEGGGTWVTMGQDWAGWMQCCRVN